MNTELCDFRSAGIYFLMSLWAELADQCELLTNSILKPYCHVRNNLIFLSNDYFQTYSLTALNIHADISWNVSDASPYLPMAAQTMKGDLRDAHENSVFSPIGHQLELENASLLINVTCCTNRRAQNIITLTQVSVNLVEPKTREIAE